MGDNNKRPDNEAPDNLTGAQKQDNERKDAVKASFRTRAFRAGSYSFVVSVIVLAIAVIVNVLLNQLPSKYTALDLTEKSFFTISDQSIQLISNLKEDVKLYWLVETGTEDPYVEQLLNRYDDLSDKLSTEKIDYVVFPGFASTYTDETITNNSVIIVCGDKSTYIDNSDIYVEDTSTNVGFTVLDFYGERAVTSAIVKITSGDTLIIYELSGHGETTLSDYNAELATSVENQNYAMQSIVLSKYETIPSDCACLMLLYPKSDLSSQDVDKIEEYLQNGGKMMFSLNPIDEETPNLDSLLAFYGIQLVDGIIVENNADFYDQSNGPAFLIPQMNTHVIINDIKDNGYSVTIPVSQGIGFLDDKRDGVYYGKFLTTSDSSYSKLAGYSMSTYVYEDGDIMGPFTVGCTVTETVNEKTSRICIFATTHMIDKNVNELSSGANYDLFLNSIDWCCNRENNISIHPKNMNITPLTFTGTEQNRLFLFMVILLPVIPLVTAVVVTTRRRRR